MTAVRDIAPDQNSRSRRNRIAFLINLTDRSSLSRKAEFNFIMPVDRDISSLEHPQIIVIDRDRKCLCAMRRKLAVMIVHIYFLCSHDCLFCNEPKRPPLQLAGSHVKHERSAARWPHRTIWISHRESLFPSF